MESLTEFNMLTLPPNTFWFENQPQIKNINGRFKICCCPLTKGEKVAQPIDIFTLFNIINDLGENLTRKNFPVLVKNIHHIQTYWMENPQECDREPAPKKIKTTNLIDKISKLATQFHYKIKTNAEGEFSCFVSSKSRDIEVKKRDEADVILLECQNGEIVSVPKDLGGVFLRALESGMQESFYSTPFDCKNFTSAVVSFAVQCQTLPPLKDLDETSLFKNERSALFDFRRQYLNSLTTNNDDFQKYFKLDEYIALFEFADQYHFEKAKKVATYYIYIYMKQTDVEKILSYKEFLFTERLIENTCITFLADHYVSKSCSSFNHKITSTAKLLKYWTKRLKSLGDDHIISRIKNQNSETKLFNKSETYLKLYKVSLEARRCNLTRVKHLLPKEPHRLRDQIFFMMVFSEYLEIIELDNRWEESPLELREFFTKDNFPKFQKINFILKDGIGPKIYHQLVKLFDNRIPIELVEEPSQLNNTKVLTMINSIEDLQKRKI